MAVERTKARKDIWEEIIVYCEVNELTFPYDEFPFEMPTGIVRARSPVPDVADCFPPLEAIPDDIFPEQTISLDLNSPAAASEDIFDTRQWRKFRYEMEAILPRTSWSSVLRKFGPDSLKHCATFPTLNLRGEDGMDIPPDDGEITRAVERDARLPATAAQAQYLTEIINGMSRKECEDVVLPKVRLLWGC
jgi:hypothetical protein